MKRGKMQVEVSGIKSLSTMLWAGQNKTLDATKEALYAEAQIILAESKEQVPFRYGVLSSSGMVHQPFIVGKKAAVEISYGGAAIDYALVQHENMTYRHAPGRKAKYLEDPVEEATKDLQARLLHTVDALLKRRIGQVSEWVNFGQTVLEVNE
jgi:hypothetical protein